MRQYLGGPPDTPERMALYHSASGQLLADRTSPPTLLVHGYPDTLVWYRHSRRLAAHLRELGVPMTPLSNCRGRRTRSSSIPTARAAQVADAAINTFLESITRRAPGSGCNILRYKPVGRDHRPAPFTFVRTRSSESFAVI